MTRPAPSRIPGASFFLNVGAMAGARMVSVVSQILVLPVIARYLTIADFGAVALAMGIVVFAQLLSDCGLGRSLVRQAKVVPEEWDSVFWLLAGIGVVLCVLLFVTAPLWAALFDMPGLTGLVQGLSVIPLMQSLSAVSNAALEREERFVWLGGLRTVAVILSLIVVVGLASAGAGAWSLIIQQIVLFAVLALGAAVASPYRPGWRFAPGLLAGHLRFARDTVATSVVFTIQRQAPVIMLGYAAGAGPLGLFSMALRLLRLPELGLSGPASQVVFVRMARRASDPVAIGALYIAALRLLALVILPGMFCLAGFAPQLIPILLTERWSDVALVFALAAPAFAVEAATSMAGMALYAAGRTGLRLRMATERAVLQIICVAVAVPFGIAAVAVTLSLFALAYTPRLWWYLHRGVPFRWQEAAAALAWPALAGALAWAGAGTFIAPVVTQNAGLLLLIAVATVVIACTFAALPQRAALRRDIALLWTN